MKINKNNFLFLLFFTIAFSSITLINNYNKIILSELIVYYFYLLIIVFTQCILFELINILLLKNVKIKNIILILALIFNAYLVNLVFIFDVNYISKLLRLYFTIYIDIFLLIPFFLFFYFLLSEFKKNFKFKLYCLFICLILAITPFYLNLKNKNENFLKEKKLVNNIFQDSNIRKDIKFKTRPNIYLIGLDSAIPKSIAQKHLDIDQLGYVESLKNSFILKNTFTQNFPTHGTVNSILNLDTDQFNKLIKNNNLNFPNIVNGKTESNLIKIFRDNNYVSSFYHPGYAFGYQRSSPNFDFYSTKSEKLFDGSFCNYNIFFRKYHLIGFCFVAQTFQKDENMDYISFIKNLKLKSSKPSINISFFYMPGHADANSYDHENHVMRNEFKDYFLKNAKKAGNFLDKFVTYLDGTKEDYILIVYGDHGPWLAANTKFKDKPRFYIEAKYAVHLSIGPKKNKCSNLIAQEELEFITINMLIAKVISCLAHSKTFINKQSYQITQDYVKNNNGEQEINFFTEPLNFKNFLYE